MKLAILVPSQEYRSNAGARIRYDRIAPSLSAAGVDLRVTEIGDFDPLQADVDAVLISKCHDARSLILAAAAAGRGKLVGVDLFDDYFSDRHDSRLVRYRNWLQQLSRDLSFVLCSTNTIAAVAQTYAPDLPMLVMNDPAPAQDIDDVVHRADLKRDEALSSGELRIAWFGVGDNPYFSVGLADLAAFSPVLAQLRQSGLTVALTVLTNRRALTSSAIAALRRIPVEVQLAEWSEAAEADLLDQAQVVFLPVSAQPFSTAKSLNRAFTALAHGCQILSAGYPLYSALDRLIYRNPAHLAADFRGGKLRFSSATKSTYAEAVDAMASPEVEGQRLASFLLGVRPRQVEQLPIRLLHGHSTWQEAHQMVRVLGGMSIASPFCCAKLDFDILFRGSSEGLEMLVPGKAPVQVRVHDRAPGDNGPARSSGGSLRPVGSPTLGGWSQEPLPFQLAMYDRAMGQIRDYLDQAFGPGRTIISESSALPFASHAMA